MTNTTEVKTRAITGRDTLARILAAVDTGAPAPTAIDGIGAGAVISYHREPGRDSRAEAAAMVRTLGLAAEPHTSQYVGYHSVTWETWDHTTEPATHWQVTAFVDGEPEPVRKLITDPVELAAAYGIAWPADACRHCGGKLIDGQCSGAENCDNPTCSHACHATVTRPAETQEG